MSRVALRKKQAKCCVECKNGLKISIKFTVVFQGKTGKLVQCISLNSVSDQAVRSMRQSVKRLRTHCTENAGIKERQN